MEAFHPQATRYVPCFVNRAVLVCFEFSRNAKPMSSDLEFVEYVRDQFSSAGGIAFRKIFGEFAVYCDGKVVALVCDKQCFVKPTAGGRTFIGAVTEGLPYPGAKPWFLIADELDDREWASELVRTTARELPPPKPKKKSPFRRARKSRRRSAGPRRSHRPRVVSPATGYGRSQETAHRPRFRRRSR